MWIIVLLLIAIIPAKIASDKGHSFVLWYLYGVCLWIVALIHSIVLKDDKEEAEQEAKNEQIRSLELEIENEKRISNVNRLFEIIKLYEKGVLSEEEYQTQKKKIWPQLCKRLNEVEKLSEVKTYYEKNLLTEEEYEEIKDATLNIENEIIKWQVKFCNSIIDGVVVEASRNASNKEIEKIVRDKNYVSEIEKIYPLD